MAYHRKSQKRNAHANLARINTLERIQAILVWVFYSVEIAKVIFITQC